MQKNWKKSIINQDKFKKIISLLLVVFWSGLIFYFSSQTGKVSENSSDTIIHLLSNFFKIFSTDIDIVKIQHISIMIRKLAHLFLYFILYFLVYHCFYQFHFQKRKYLSLLYCFIFAVSDEFHQMFVPLRSSEVMDVLIDTFGSILAYFCLLLKSKIQKKKVK